MPPFGLRILADRLPSIQGGVFGMKELSRMSLDTTTLVSLGYTGVANPQADLFAREGVLELVPPKVMKMT
jgi:lactoylglutathione lyase